MKILILKFRNIGDVLLITPLISNLKQHYPQAIIDIAVNNETKDMLTLHPYIHKVIEYNRVPNISLWQKIKKELAFIFSFRGKYDMVINLTSGDRGNYIAKFSGAKTKIGYPSTKFLFKNLFDYRLPKQEFRHTLETNLDPLKLLDIPIKDKKVQIFWDDNDEKIVQNLIQNFTQTQQKFIHIHPVSRWLFKCINDKTFAQIIDYLNNIGYETIITASPDKKEITKIDNIIKLCENKPLNFAGKLSIKQVAYLNSLATMFIGVDTAIMHISAANNTPTLAFFGPSGGDHWGPWDNDVMQSGYAQRNGLQHMGKHTIIAESRECQPCGKDGCDGSKISDCLMDLDLKIITQEIDKKLNG
jgi:heptosyltransferase-3